MKIMINFKKSYENVKRFLPLLLLIVFLIPPVYSLAQAADGPLIPNCSPNCGFYDLLRLVNNIINWIIMISFPIAAGVLAWAGFKYMTTGISDQKSEAKKMIQKVFLGFVFILSAWIIVGTITNTLLRDPNIVDQVVDVKP